MKQYKTKLLNKECILTESNIPEMYIAGETITLEREDIEDVWTVVGRLSELTDEDIVELTNYAECFHKDYVTNLYTLTPSESFFSALQAEGLFLNGNPYQDEWDELCTWGHGGFSKDGKSEYELYHEAEARTFDPTRTILLIKNLRK